MDTETYLTAINAPGVNVLTVEWTTSPKPAARHRGTVLRKITTAMVMVGVDYSTLSVNNGAETGDLPWGEWAMFPYIVTHKGTDYARLYTVDGTVRSIYMVGDAVVDRDTFNGYLTPSAAAAKRPNGGCITVKMSNIALTGAPALAGV